MSYLGPTNNLTWQPIGPALPSAELSDEAAGALRFTGTMIALYAQDFTGAGLSADFDFLDYHELPFSGKS